MINSLIVKAYSKTLKGERQSGNNRFEFERSSKRVVEKKVCVEV